MSGGFVSDMNARVRANLSIRKRGGYFRDAKAQFVNPVKYKKGKPPERPAPEELQRIRERAAAFAQQDRQQQRRNVMGFCNPVDPDPIHWNGCRHVVGVNYAS